MLPQLWLFDRLFAQLPLRLRLDALFRIDALFGSGSCIGSGVASASSFCSGSCIGAGVESGLFGSGRCVDNGMSPVLSRLWRSVGRLFWLLRDPVCRRNRLHELLHDDFLLRRSTLAAVPPLLLRRNALRCSDRLDREGGE